MVEGARNVLKVGELNKNVKERTYRDGMRGKYEVLRDWENELEKVQRYNEAVYQ